MNSLKNTTRTGHSVLNLRIFKNYLAEGGWRGDKDQKVALEKTILTLSVFYYIIFCLFIL